MKVFHDHSNAWRKLYSVTQGRETIAVAKPVASMRGWWMLQGRGICWINPDARDLSAVRADGWKPPKGMSTYEAEASHMLIKGAAKARKELMGLVAQGERPRKGK